MRKRKLLALAVAASAATPGLAVVPAADATTAVGACRVVGLSEPAYYDPRCILKIGDEDFDPSLLILDVVVGVASIAALGGGLALLAPRMQEKLRDIEWPVMPIQ